MVLLLSQIDLPSLNDSASTDIERLLGIFFVLFAAGFVVGVIGHLAASKPLQIAGIALVFASTAVFFIGLGSNF